MSERQHPLATLTKMRLLEFVREPEALFWVFAFPVLMALVLGFAFRDRPPDPVPVGIVAGPSASELTQALGRSGAVKPSAYPSLADGLEALRTGKIALLVEESGALGLTYHFDRTRPDARTHFLVSRRGVRTNRRPVLSSTCRACPARFRLRNARRISASCVAHRSAIATLMQTSSAPPCRSL